MEERMKIEVEVQDEHEATAIRAILTERRRQDNKFGEQNHDPAWWMVIMGEEFGETCQAVCEYRWGNPNDGRSRQQRIAHAMKEADEVGAVAVAMIQALLRDAYHDEITTAKPSDKRQVAVALDLGHEAINYDGMTTDEIIALGRESIKQHHPDLYKQMVDAAIMCPECAAGKHVNCTHEVLLEDGGYTMCPCKAWSHKVEVRA